LSSPRVKTAAYQFAAYLKGNIGKLRWLAKLQGVKLDEYNDREILEIIQEACRIALTPDNTFDFRPIYQTPPKT
jgi:hypothetical protein